MNDFGVAIGIATIGIGLMSIAGVWALSIFKSPKEESRDMDNRSSQRFSNMEARMSGIDSRLTAMEIDYARSHATISTLVHECRADIAELKLAFERFADRFGHRQNARRTTKQSR